jgi:pimeloyl-ACP methyl ester carboxylesterase
LTFAGLRKYGDPPFSVAVIHGGPGAAGGMAPVARELSHIAGVLEPLQAADSIDGQVEELFYILSEHGDIPVTLIGHSWGAWLCLIFAARHPSFVKKLILVGCAPLEEKYARGIMETRLDRLNEAEKAEAYALMDAMGEPGAGGRNEIFARFGALMAKADSYDPLPGTEDIAFREDINRSVWAEADALRRSGALLEIARRVRCPVVAIHGDHDPHPVEGVEKPLAGAIKDFSLIILKKCGHEPWKERHAKAAFYRLLPVLVDKPGVQ